MELICYFRGNPVYMTSSMEIQMSDTFRDFTREVGEWSEHNFDDNDGWGHAAPLLGIHEELSELELAIEKEDILDAYADIAIYFADFCYRQQLDVDFNWSIEEFDDATAAAIGIQDVVVAAGQLTHVVLKTQQGIRHYGDPEFARAKLLQSSSKFWYSLVDAFENDPYLDEFSFHESVWQVWNHVKQRDWKKDPRTANQIVEDAVEDVQEASPFQP
jgi:hypothetical protein